MSLHSVNMLPRWALVQQVASQRCIVQTEQEWATKLKKLEADRDRALAAKDTLLQQAMQKAQQEAQSAMQRLRSDSAAEAKKMSTKHETEIATLKVRSVTCRYTQLYTRKQYLEHCIVDRFLYSCT